jgi:hypothetical protein
MDIIFGIGIDETFAMPSDCGKGLEQIVDILKLLFQDIPVEDGMRDADTVPRNSRTLIDGFSLLRVWGTGRSVAKDGCNREVVLLADGSLRSNGRVQK